MEDGSVVSNYLRNFSAEMIELDFERAEKSQELWLKAHKDHVLDAAAEAAETGEAVEVPLKDLLAGRNRTKVFTPDDLDYALRAVGASVEQHGLGDGRDPTAALVPLGPAFVYADAVPAQVVEAPVTPRTGRTLATLDRLRSGKAGKGFEKHVMALLVEMCSDPGFGSVLSAIGWATVDGSPAYVDDDRSAAPRPVAAHRVAGMPSREKMWVERDAVLSSTSARTGGPVLRVVEAKGHDPELFSTQQLGRGRYATLVDDNFRYELDAGAEVETWSVHLADRSDHAHALRLYRVEYAGDDTVFDRLVTGTFEVRFG